MGWLKGSRISEIKKLIAQLDHPDRAERAASELLRLQGDAVPALVEAVASGETSAALVLTRMGPAALPQLQQLLARAHPLLRIQAATMLGRIGDAAAVPALLDALRGEFYTVRAAAALALGEIGHSRAIESLLVALKDPEPQVRIAALKALGKFREPGTFEAMANLLLDDPEIDVRQAAARALGASKHPAALSFLMEALADSFWWYERETAAASLLQGIQGMGSLAVEPLIDSLSDTEATVRRYAAGILGELRDPRALQPLGMALFDMHHEVGSAAARALGLLGEASLDILEAASPHPEPAIREHVALALAAIDHPRSVTVLVDLLGDSDRTVQKQAIASLSRMHDPRAAAALIKCAGDRSDRELQALAKDILSKMSFDTLT
jgi:HEAT repeat protein